MKKLFFIAAAMFLFVGFANKATAQTRTAVTTATIVKPVNFTKLRDLDFGSISNLGGNVTIAALEAGTVSGSAIVLTGTPASAKFNINGLNGSKFNITMPITTLLVTNTTGTVGETMPVTLTNSGFGSYEFTSSLLTMDVFIGGNIIVGVNQVPGIYKNLTGIALTLAYE